jgi:glycosyltransferase involved in cell wall biosynthesis
MMKLCFVADTNHANAANWLRYFAVELGHDIHAVSLTGVTRDIKGVTLYNLKTSQKLLLLTRVAALRKLLQHIRPDLVIAYRVQSYGFLCACTGFSPLVLVAQSASVAWPPNSRIMAMLCKYAIRRANWIFSWSEQSTRSLIRLGASPSRIDTFPRGIRPELFFPAPDNISSTGNSLISARSLEPEYNHESIVLAAQELSRTILDLKYIIAGEGREREKLERLVRETGLASAVQFLGYVANSELPDYLRKADVYVSVCIEDSVSSSLLEAMACGLLPVVPDTEANRNWVQDGVNGLLFRPNDYPSLVAKLREAISNSTLRRNARDHNVALVHKNVNWHVNMRRIESRLLKLIAESKAGADGFN